MTSPVLWGVGALQTVKWPSLRLNKSYVLVYVCIAGEVAVDFHDPEAYITCRSVDEKSAVSSEAEGQKQDEETCIQLVNQELPHDTQQARDRLQDNEREGDDDSRPWAVWTLPAGSMQHADVVNIGTAVAAIVSCAAVLSVLFRDRLKDL